MFRYIFFVIPTCVLFLFSSCEKMDDTDIKNQVLISLNFKKFKKVWDKAKASKAMITIKKGNSPYLTDNFVDVTDDGTKITLDLENGKYAIETLVLGDNSFTSKIGTYPDLQNAYYFVPKSNDKQSTASAALPYKFTVEDGKIKKNVGDIGASGSISLEIIDVSTPAPPDVSVKEDAGIKYKDVFSYGIKVLDDANNAVANPVVKIWKGQIFVNDILFYGDNYLNKNKGSGDNFPYFIFPKENNIYKFFVSKFGYVTKQGITLNSTTSSKNASQKVVLKKLTGSTGDVYVKSSSSINIDGDKLQRGGANFGSKAYWDYLPVINNATAYRIDQGTNSGSGATKMTKIKSKYSLPNGSYQVKIYLYDKTGAEASANALFKVGIGAKIYWFKKGGTGSGANIGTDKANAEKLSTYDPSGGLGSPSETIDFNSVQGNLSFEVTDSAKDKIYFLIYTVTLK